MKKEGDKLVYAQSAAPFGGDGRMSEVTLVWEKIKTVTKVAVPLSGVDRRAPSRSSISAFVVVAIIVVLLRLN